MWLCHDLRAGISGRTVRRYSTPCSQHWFPRSGFYRWANATLLAHCRCGSLSLRSCLTLWITSRWHCPTSCPVGLYTNCLIREISSLFKCLGHFTDWHDACEAVRPTSRMPLQTRQAVRSRFLAQSSWVPSHLSPHAAGMSSWTLRTTQVIGCLRSLLCSTLSELTD